jgi:disulfide bond formation protein DsbB
MTTSPETLPAGEEPVAEAAAAVADGRLETDWLLLFAAWIVAAVATAGSLFFSSVLDFAPCLLCWYQRICLFPLVVLLARALFPLDRGVVRYALPLVAIGWLIAAYHNLVYAGVVPESLQPCRSGVSCSERHLALLGFVSIPLLSLLAFTSLAALLAVVARRRSS